MGLINLLASIGLPSFGNLGEVALKHEWIVNIIKWIIGLVGDVGLGIIIFTVLLKLITLPLDIYSRAAMKSNSLKMELMKEDLEKLQKQYANNQQLYQQKMMALQKKNGYSAFSACLPTIVTLIFFIVVINAFNSYSRFADKDVFNKMGEAYENSLVTFEEKGILEKNEGTDSFVLNINKALEEKGYGIYFNGYEQGKLETETSAYTLNFETFISNNSLISEYEKLSAFIKDGKLNKENTELTNRINADCQTFIVKKLSASKIKDLIDKGIIKDEGKEIYTIRNLSAFVSENPSLSGYFKEETFEINYSSIIEESAEILAKFEEQAKNYICEVSIKVIGEDYLEKTVKSEAREASKKAYEENANKSIIFPWVKNLWVVDSPFKKAIPSISELQASIGAENMGSLKEEEVYSELTYNLGNYKQSGFGKGNGLFILVALSILSMLGSTIFNNKQQKTQMQLSSVDGENSTAASTQKMMTWMMPIMFGFFSFIYSAAFSIYMITSTLLSTLFSFLIGYFVEKSFKNKLIKAEEEKAAQRKYGKRR